MDMLGYIRKEIGDEEYQNRKGFIEAQIRHAPTMLLDRLSSSVS